jgi:hypothetical protein
MSKQNNILFCLVVLAVLVFPKLSFADYGYFTMPLAASDTNGISSWFDHTYPLGLGDTGTGSTIFTKYTGAQSATSSWIALKTCGDPGTGNGAFCYNGHSGIDFRTQGVEGKDVLAAASGTVEQVQWYDPNNTSTGFGFFVRLWHPQYNLSTLYGHATSTNPVVNVSDTVARAKKIAVSGQTGCYDPNHPLDLCPHLHFQIYNNGNTDVNTSTGLHFASSVDPYGWSGQSLQATDTWSGDMGYLWTSTAATSSYITTSTGVMTASTTWLADQTYVIQGSLTVSSTATLTIKQGAVVKFDSPTTYLQVDGKLDVQGTASDPVYFTSLKDDSVGGDANDDATTTSAAPGNWAYIQFDVRSTSTIKNAIIRYGGNHIQGNNPFSEVHLNGGYLSATSTLIASSSYYGLQAASGTVKITTSTFIGNTNYGIFVDGVVDLTITSSSFSNNTTAAGFIALQNGPTFTHTGNSASGNGPSGGVSGEGNGFIMQGNQAVTTSTWGQDTIPYILSAGVTIPSGKTLTINPGVVAKSDSVTFPAALTIDGKLIVSGTSTNRVYFTSINDDSADGRDTNNNGVSTGTVGLWGSVVLDTGSTSTISNAVFRYGGQIGGGGYLANVYVNGGYLSATSTVFASSSLYGLRMASGTVKITTSTFNGNANFGFYISNIGDFTVTTSSFSDNGIAAGDGAGFIAFDHGATFTSSGNTSTRDTWNGFLVDGVMVASQTWTNDLPYIIQGVVTVSSSKTLTVNPGAIIKFDNSQSSLVVDGTLNVKGTTSTNMIYFTSLKDDSIGGDTNNDGISSGTGGDWDHIQLDSGSSSTLNYAMVRYGGHVNSPSSADIYMGGGKLTAWHDIVASSSFYAIQVASGTVTIASSTIRGDGSTSTLDVVNSTNVTSSFTAKQNYWDSSSGPYNATGHSTGTTDGVDDHVTFIPWLTSKPL